MFNKEFIERLKSTVPISSIIKRKVALKQTGQKYIGICPFHKEKTPSFHVSDIEGFYHCFGCAAHGDVIKFVEETERLSFHEAVTSLCNQAGIAIPKSTSFNIEEEQKKVSLYDIMQMATLIFKEQLLQNKNALSYLHKRGFSNTIIEKFNIGFAEDSFDVILKKLTSKNITQELLHGCGLIKKGDNKTYDTFRNRIIIPITDKKGRVIAFGGRLLNSDEKQAKYINSKETELFKKSEVLFNYKNARENSFAIGSPKTKELIVVEGYMDVISLTQHGFGNCVAPLGTSLTEGHLQLLWEISNIPTICFDSDIAGRNAMIRVLYMVLPHLKPGFSCKFINLKGYKDPDELLQKQGSFVMKQAIEDSNTLEEVLWSIEKNKINIKGADGIALFESNILKSIFTITDELVRKSYIDSVKKRLWEEGRFSVKTKINKKSSELINYHNISYDKIASIETNIIAFLLKNHYIFLEEGLLELYEIKFINQELQDLYNFISSLVSIDNNITTEEIIKRARSAFDSKMLINIENNMERFVYKNKVKEIVVILYKKLFLSHQLIKIESEIKLAMMGNIEMSEGELHKKNDHFLVEKNKITRNLELLEKELSVIEF